MTGRALPRVRRAGDPAENRKGPTLADEDYKVTSAGVAERVAGRAESIAKALVSYGRHPPGGQSRDNLVASVELLMERMRVEWFCLTMQYRLEVQEAASAGQDETHQPN